VEISEYAVRWHFSENIRRASIIRAHDAKSAAEYVAKNDMTQDQMYWPIEVIELKNPALFRASADMRVVQVSD
jgi:hypothetical protein